MATGGGHLAGLLGFVPAVALVGGCGALAQAPVRPPERIYATSCGYCHGHNVGPVIRGRALPPELTLMMVRQGRGPMPAFRQTEISPTELDLLARWLQASATDPGEHGK